MSLYHALLSRLKNQHEAIKHIINNADEQRINLKPAPGKWSIHDNIAHLARYQPVFLDRINTILNTDMPAFERYRAEDDPAFESWRERNTADLLDILGADRQIIFELITSLPEEELSRMGVHRKFGNLSVIGWTEFFLLHEAHHIFTMFQLVNDVELG